MARAAKTKTKPAQPTRRTKRSPFVSPARSGTKAATVMALLKSKQGTTICQMMEATGWQAHSVRGFLAGSLRKRHGLQAESEKIDGEPRRYRLA